jgi:recombination protein RecA
MAEPKSKKEKEKEKDDPFAGRRKALDQALEQIEKSHGKGSIMRLSERAVQQIEVISTGCIALDAAIGAGGLPRGRITEIFGPESSGKTTICLHAIAQAQRNGGLAAFIDTEHALDTTYAQHLGVDLQNLLVSQPEFGEQALDIVETLVRSGAVDIIVIDSVAALIPRVELEGEMGESQVGAQARLMSLAMRKLNMSIGKSNACVVFTNQLRAKINSMGYGPNETTTGGNALKFYASLRLDVRKTETVKSGENIIGNRVKVKCVKNKIAPPFKLAEFEVVYPTGISRTGELIDFGIEFKFMTKSGSWLAFGDHRAQGREGMREYLRENPDAAADLEAKIINKLHSDPNAIPIAPPIDGE